MTGVLLWNLVDSLDPGSLPEDQRQNDPDEDLERAMAFAEVRAFTGAVLDLIDLLMLG